VRLTTTHQGTEGRRADSLRTETKAITVYPVKELFSVVPVALHSAIRASRYHTANNDSLTFQAQSHRSRTANLEENGRKLLDEITRIYHENIPAETSKEKKEKHKDMYDTRHLTTHYICANQGQCCKIP
jgi:peptidyl-tRNA hydrolase ICT1